MDTKPQWLGRAPLLAAITATLAILGGTAEAQSADSAPVATTPRAPDANEARIRVLEEEVKALSAQIADLKASLTSNVADLRKAQPTTTTTLAADRPTIASTDGQQRFAVRALVQMDAAHYDEKGDAAIVNDLSSGTNFRRVRFGVEGTFASDWNYVLTTEFGGSGGEAAQLNAGYVEYAGWKPGLLKNPLRLRVGAWATPTGLEDGINNADGPFLERPAVAEMVRNIAAGDARTGAGVITYGDHWYADAVFTGALVNGPSTTALGTPEFDEQTAVIGRLAINPAFSKDYAIHIGANVQSVLDPADTSPGAANSKTLRLRERPELRVDGTRLVDTGAITGDGLIAYGGELGAQYKNFLLYGEAFKIDINGHTPFEPSFSGWYVTAAWTLTGETRPWVNATGGFRGVRPTANFDPTKGQWGAWEVAARYSTLDLDDHAGIDGAPVPLGGIRGGEQDITTIGLNWYPNAVFRFLLDYQWIHVRKFGTAAPVLNRLYDEDVQAVSFRSQFAF